MAKVYEFLANGFEEIEGLAPVDILRRGGVDIKTVSVTGTEWVETSHGVTIKADLKFEDIASFEDADMLMIPGGMPGSTNLNEHEGVRQALIAQHKAGKRIGAICAAPMVLASTGILEGKKATCYPGFEQYFGENTEYTATLFQEDGNVITGEGPAATLPYAYKILSYFVSKENVISNIVDYVIIVAGGKGLRMGSEIPKQFLPVAGKPILMRTIERFHEYDPSLNIILVLPESQQAYWHQLCEEHHFSIKHQIANGGDTRFQSSKNGLALIPDDEDGVVGIHDGVRPFVSKEVIEECFETAREEYAAIPVYAVTDTLRYIDQHGGGKNVLRSDYRVVQTPQTFDIGLAKQAFNQEYKEQFTDDASVVESLGCQVAMVEGNRENIKITTPFDIKIAEALLG